MGSQAQHLLPKLPAVERPRRGSCQSDEAPRHQSCPDRKLDCEDFDRTLLEFRNTPNSTGRSPAQVLYGRPLRSCLPAHQNAFLPEWQAKADDCDRRAAARLSDVTARYDAQARPLPKLCVGQRVLLQDPVSKRWDKAGTVMGVGHSRNYEVVLPSGRAGWRNRRHLRPLPEPPQQPPQDKEAEPPTPRRSERLRQQTPET